jgi:hypothetical protein
MPLRSDFPEAGSTYLGGESDGWEYRSVFRGTTLQQTYDMLRRFLREEGYADLPLPANAEELLKFRLATRNKQILLFEDNGYVHNPIKILFPENRRDENALVLRVFNEAAPQHLLRFHRKL